MSLPVDTFFLVILRFVFVVFRPPEMNLGVSPAGHEEADDMGRIKNVVKMLRERIICFLGTSDDKNTCMSLSQPSTHGETSLRNICEGGRGILDKFSLSFPYSSSSSFSTS